MFENAGPRRSQTTRLSRKRAGGRTVDSAVLLFGEAAHGLPETVPCCIQTLRVVSGEGPGKFLVQRSRDLVDRGPSSRIVDQTTEIRHLNSLQPVRED